MIRQKYTSYQLNIQRMVSLTVYIQMFILTGTCNTNMCAVNNCNCPRKTVLPVKSKTEKKYLWKKLIQGQELLHFKILYTASRTVLLLTFLLIQVGTLPCSGLLQLFQCCRVSYPAQNFRSVQCICDFPDGSAR